MVAMEPGGWTYGPISVTTPPTVPPPVPRPRTALLIIFALLVAGVLVLAGFYVALTRRPAADNGLLPSVERSTWAFDMVQAEALRAAGYDGGGVVVCVVDSGIDVAHPALQGVPVLAWKDLIGGRASPYDDEGHGTAMAALIAGRDPLPGAAPAASLIVVKAINADGEGTSDGVAAAIRFCEDPNSDGGLFDGADLISLSLGGARRALTGTSAGTAAQAAAQKGILVVAAAGNDGESDDGDVQTPASEELVIAVGAVNANGVLASFSSRGDNDGRLPVPWDDRQPPNEKPEVVAPGVDIAVAWRDGLYAIVSGTSPAAAVASGALALLLDAHPELRMAGESGVRAVKNALMDTAYPSGGQAVPHDDHYGYGLLQAREASDVL